MHTIPASRACRHPSANLVSLAALVLLLCAQPAQAYAKHQASRRNAGAARADQRAAPDDIRTEPRVDASVPGDWLTEVSEKIRRQEYDYSAVDTELWSAPNRSQELRSRVDRNGLEVFPRETDASGEDAVWKLRIGTASFGRVGDGWPTPSRAVSVDGERAELDRGGLIEWFVNDERGIEQGWTIENRPPGIEPLAIGLAIEGDLSLRLDDSGRSGVFVDGAGKAQLRYGGLVAWDATGAEIRAWMLPGPAGVLVHVDDSAAVYPINVDSLMTNASWTAESNQVDTGFGYSVSTAGDVNGDGYSDVIVGAPNYDNGLPDTGRAYVYLGSSTGLETTEAWVAELTKPDSLFGWSVSTAGDVNGDGYSDVIVGARNFGNFPPNVGRAFVYHGSATGLSAAVAWGKGSSQSGSFFGWSVSTAGDVNGDGYSDVIVGASFYSNGQSDEGRAYVFHGSATGLEFSEAWTAESNSVAAHFGWSVSTAGDVNGDGYSDVVVGAPDLTNGASKEGRVYFYHGSATGLETTSASRRESNIVNARFGASVSTAGDINGDGYSDVIVGAPRNGSPVPQYDPGRVYVYHGSSTGLVGAVWVVDLSDSTYNLSVSTAGDVNGDGYSDVIAGVVPGIGLGFVYAYHGSADGLGATEAWTVQKSWPSGLFGQSVSNAGDVNGDGYGDVIVGEPPHNFGPSQGRASVYHGSAAGLSPSDEWTTEQNQAEAGLGYSVSTAGDVNGDGYSDAIVGAPFYDNGGSDGGRAWLHLGSETGVSAAAAWTADANQSGANFGYPVSTAGDVNGDGFADVIVGAYLYDNGEVDEGRAYVYHGSAAGLGAVEAWTAESNQSHSAFGIALSTAGDVNGDGYSDVIIGARFFDNGEPDEGRSYVYHGSAGGLESTASWTAESNQAEASFGWSTSTAGDVDGDGYSDVIVGAVFYDNGESDEGRAYVYHGSADGLGATERWTAESDQADAWFSWSVATAGDVNGDGYSDVVVGARRYDNGETDEGRAYVYHGSAAGLRSKEARTLEPNQAAAAYGSSVSTAGDVNGDGYSDVIVGSPFYDNGETDTGRAYLYHGSATGLSAVEAWIAESTQAFAYFGESVSTAGDVNGDGYSDVIVGTPSFTNGEAYEGRAQVYLGNDGDGGLVRALQQRDRTNARPISVLGSTTSNGLFHLRARFPQHVAAQAWPSPGARRAWLEWEVKPLGVAFDGKGIQRGAARTLLPTAGDVTFNEPIQLGRRGKKVRFTPEALYHWRARVATNNPLFAHTAWFSAPGNHITESKLRKPTALR